MICSFRVSNQVRQNGHGSARFAQGLRKVLFFSSEERRIVSFWIYFGQFSGQLTVNIIWTLDMCSLKKVCKSAAYIMIAIMMKIQLGSRHLMLSSWAYCFVGIYVVPAISGTPFKTHVFTSLFALNLGRLEIVAGRILQCLGHWRDTFETFASFFLRCEKIF